MLDLFLLSACFAASSWPARLLSIDWCLWAIILPRNHFASFPFLSKAAGRPAQLWAKRHRGKEKDGGARCGGRMGKRNCRMWATWSQTGGAIEQLAVSNGEVESQHSLSGGLSVQRLHFRAHAGRHLAAGLSSRPSHTVSGR